MPLPRAELVEADVQGNEVILTEISPDGWHSAYIPYRSVYIVILNVEIVLGLEELQFIWQRITDVLGQSIVHRVWKLEALLFASREQFFDDGVSEIVLLYYWIRRFCRRKRSAKDTTKPLDKECLGYRSACGQLRRFLTEAECCDGRQNPSSDQNVLLYAIETKFAHILSWKFVPETCAWAKSKIY
ncbi:hypothetical protein BDN70DRAFT_902370 [Pholiota conissans]|uniref:Uncharacterized protein n=1 Tax=Pholiota conissans TaxID=109636 RepID=A0A9P6CRJ5_9AGAR|nr:hypothetical protein BDN70DRAFT_902370 [Pholiota conissans]